MSGRARLAQLMYTAGDRVGNRLLCPPRTAFGRYVNHGPRDHRRIALTFDDGPSKGATDHLLDTLADLDVRATFFCVGENVAVNPELVVREFQAGHAIGNHSLAHSRGAGLSLGDTDHIDRGARAISDAIGVEPTIYRPPWGWLTPWEARRLHRRGYAIIGWDVYTLDWPIPEPPAAGIADSVIADLRPGSIVCLHDAFPLEPIFEKQVTAEVVRTIVPRLIDDGYEFVTVPELLDIPAFRTVESRVG